MFLNSFNYFRGIAILYIVAGHTYWFAHWYISKPWERVISNLVSGGTVLFVFISGFLFHHVFYSRFNYFDFLRKKFRNVFVPYLILSGISIFYWVAIQKAGPFGEHFFNHAPGIWNQYIRPSLLYLWTGASQAPYWYIPFIMLTFLASPLHVQFIKLNEPRQRLTIILLLIISILLQRPVNNLNPVHSFVYFTSAYCLGIYCSIYRDRIYRLLEGKEIWILLPVLGLAAFQAWRFPSVSIFAKPAFSWGFPDILFLQKIFLAIFFFIFLHRFEKVRIKPLEYLAKASFAIYFLHAPIIGKLAALSRKYELHYSGNILTWLIFTAMILSMSYLTAIWLKRSVGENRSRYLIGW